MSAVDPSRADATEAFSRARWLALAVPVLSSGVFLALMYTAVAPVLPALALSLGQGAAGTLLAQLVMTMPSIGMIAGGIVSGWVAARLGARRLLLMALALYGASGASGLVVTAAAPMLVSRLLLGLAASGIATSATTLLAECFSASRRATLMGWQSSIGGLAGLASTLVAGLLAQQWGWRAPFTFYLLGWVVAAVAVWSVPSCRGIPLQRHPGRPQDHGVPWRRLRGTYLLCVPLYASVFMTTTQVPFLLQADGVDSPSLKAWVLAGASLCNAVGSACYGTVSRRIGTGWTFVISLALMAVGQAVLGCSHQSWLTAVGCAIAGSGGGLAVPHVPGMVLAQVQEAERSRALGLMYSFLFLGSFSNPLLVAPLAAAFGPHGALLATAAMVATGAASAAVMAFRANKAQHGTSLT